MEKKCESFKHSEPLRQRITIELKRQRIPLFISLGAVAIVDILFFIFRRPDIEIVRGSRISETKGISSFSAFLFIVLNLIVFIVAYYLTNKRK